MFTMVSGMLYFQEYIGMSDLSGGLFGAGSALLLAGVWVVASSMGDYYQTVRFVALGLSVF